MPYAKFDEINEHGTVWDMQERLKIQGEGQTARILQACTSESQCVWCVSCVCVCVCFDLPRGQ